MIWTLLVSWLRMHAMRVRGNDHVAEAERAIRLEFARFVRTAIGGNVCRALAGLGMWLVPSIAVLATVVMVQNSNEFWLCSCCLLAGLASLPAIFPLQDVRCRLQETSQVAFKTALFIAHRYPILRYDNAAVRELMENGEYILLIRAWQRPEEVSEGFVPRLSSYQRWSVNYLVGALVASAPCPIICIPDPLEVAPRSLDEPSASMKLLRPFFGVDWKDEVRRLVEKTKLIIAIDVITVGQTPGLAVELDFIRTSGRERDLLYLCLARGGNQQEKQRVLDLPNHFVNCCVQGLPARINAPSEHIRWAVGVFEREEAWDILRDAEEELNDPRRPLPSEDPGTPD